MLKSVHANKRIDDPCGGVAYSSRFETFNYGGRQRMSVDDVATVAAVSEPGGLVV